VGKNSPWANSSSLLPSMNNFRKEKWTKWQSQSNCPRERTGLGNSNQIAMRSNFIEEKGTFLNEKKSITSQTY